MEHSPTPWRVNVSALEYLEIRSDGENGQICGCGEVDSEIDQANAAFIVQAVNAHDALVEALEEARDYLPHHDDPALTQKVDAALALAKGESQ